MAIAYTILEAAQAVGYSDWVIKKAIAAGDITPRYANSKPIIPHTELVAWVESLPVDKPQ
jgi:hypothetical protein